MKRNIERTFRTCYDLENMKKLRKHFFESGGHHTMGKIINLSAVLEKEEKLQQVVDYMEELKDQFFRFDPGV